MNIRPFTSCIPMFVTVSQQALGSAISHPLKGRDCFAIVFPASHADHIVGAGDHSRFRPDPIEQARSCEFGVGEKNSTRDVLDLREMAGIPIEDIERDLKKTAWLGRGEALLSKLASDNDYVLSHGLTHQKIASSIAGVMLLFRLAHVYPLESSEQRCVEMCKRFIRHTVSSALLPKTPLVEDVENNHGVSQLFDGVTGARLINGAVQIDMIMNYGFYGGYHSPWRIEPRDIIRALYPEIIREEESDDEIGRRVSKPQLP